MEAAMATLAQTRSAQSFPRLPLIGAAALVGFALLAAIVGRVSGIGAAQPESIPISARYLRFEDRSDGAVTIYDARINPTDTNATPIAVATGQNGFLRGVLRGFARTRKAEHVGHEAPFLLTAWQDGRLTLLDPSTGRRADLEAFGPTNVAVFARFLVPPGPVTTKSSQTGTATR
jgi:putative photosynthetic complex assembly protein